MTTDNQMIKKNVELINQVATEAVTERQETHAEVLNVDSVRSLNARCLNQQIKIQHHRKLKKRTQGNGESSKKLIAVHTRIIQRAVPAVRKGNMRKMPGNESTARRMPQSKMHLKFNMGRDNRVARKQLQPKRLRTSDKIIRKHIEIKDQDLKKQLHSRTKKTFCRLSKKTVARQMVMENRIVGSSIGLQDVGDWMFWKVRPPPKRNKAQETAGDPESLEPLLHLETLIA
jgi:hypothetical protein